ncbi:iron-containing alcohol dehydrogenase [Thermotomaculum hydrothermale]|uniref:Iron-containing alcohol dehydrogenase n=1 Tax=Thermotomaculum hydrothermale TaxID=981385 RepID=A0A7R6PF87_9BACT|nr:iron-containing alcohol dehydrogenase [Thermotomaculum hydrothermale]BBB32643.1 iron-containing alcohol dehydrogenase [Thermotomaculum hydrothermale]
MRDFIFFNPVKVYFGKKCMKYFGNEAKKHGKKALLVYGKGSIKKNGAYHDIVNSLEKAEIEFVEFSGVRPNPVLSHTKEGIELAKKEKVDFIIAAGGGSVIDESKAIAAGAVVDFDVWNFYTGEKTPEKALPLITVLTLPATASEMNMGSVITNEENGLKLSTGAEVLYPKASFLNPNYTMTLPEEQIVYGTVDAISHIVEPYFNHTAEYNILSLNVADGVLKSLKENCENILNEPNNYNFRANHMWSVTVAFNGLIRTGLGRSEFPNHAIEHAISGLFPDVAHGAGLAVVMPAWMRFVKEEKEELLKRFGQNLFKLENHKPDHTIEAFKNWLKSIGAPVSLGEIGIKENDIEKIAEKAYEVMQFWAMDTDKYSKENIEKILTFAL